MTQWQHTAYVYPVAFAAVTAGILTAYGLAFARRRGRRRDARLRSFVVLAGLVTLWTAATAVKVLAVDPGTKLAAYRVLTVGGALAPPTFLVFALAYTDREEWLDSWTVGGLFVVPLAFLLAVLVNPWDLGYTGWDLTTTNGVTTIYVRDGLLAVVGYVYGFVVLFGALGVVGQYALRLDRRFRPQAVLLLSGVLVPMAVAALQLTGLAAPATDGVNLIPASLSVPAVTFGLAVFRYRLFDVRPLAYATASEHSRDGLVVLDADGVVVHANDVARSFLDGADGVVGRPAADVFPMHDRLTDGGGPLDLRIDGDPAHYVEVERYPLEQSRGLVGWVVSLRDVTQRKRYELSLEERNERLEVINRIVRHDIRNDMQLVMAYADLVGTDESLSPTGESHLATVRRRAAHTVELTDVLGQLMRATEGDEPVHAVDVAVVVSETVDDLRGDYPDATFAVGDLPRAPVLANDLLDSAVENILKNAVVHADRPDPTVAVDLSVADGTVTVRIEDDGPGIADDVKDVVFGRGEKGPASPGTGTGLYLVETIVENFGGAVRIEDADPRGAVFVVELPAADESASD